MILAKYTKAAEKFVTDNSPLILTVIGAVGTATTAYLTGKATFEAAQQISDKQFEVNVKDDTRHVLTTKEKVLLVWKVYIPPAGVCVTTITAIICANRISTSRAAALAAAYKLSEKRIDEYKEKVAEKLGVRKESEVRDELAQQRVDRVPASVHEVIILGDGQVKCFDQPSERYFINTMEGVRQAVNDVNQQVLINGYATLADFYEQINLKPTLAAHEIGWTPDDLLDVHISSVIPAGASAPALAIDYDAKPIRGFK